MGPRPRNPGNTHSTHTYRYSTHSAYTQHTHMHTHTHMNTLTHSQTVALEYQEYEYWEEQYYSLLSRILFCSILHYIVLHCTVLYDTALYRTVLYYTALYCTLLFCIALYCAILYCSALPHLSCPALLYFSARTGDIDRPPGHLQVRLFQPERTPYRPRLRYLRSLHRFLIPFHFVIYYYFCFILCFCFVILYRWIPPSVTYRHSLLALLHFADYFLLIWLTLLHCTGGSVRGVNRPSPRPYDGHVVIVSYLQGK
jgi:hypothetical protein